MFAKLSFDMRDKREGRREERTEGRERDMFP